MALRYSKSSVFYSVFTLTVSNIGLQLLGFIYRIVLSRLIGAQGLGVFQLVSPYYYVIHALSLSGITMAASRLCAECSALGDAEGARRALRLCFLFFAIMFALVAVPTLLFSDGISRSLLGDARTRTALVIFLPCLMFTGIENIIKNYFFGTNNMKPPITSELCEQCVRIAAVAALILHFNPIDAGHAAALIALGMVISEIVSSSLLCIFYKKHRPVIKLGAPASHGLSRKILSVALPVSVTGVINNLLSSAISVLIPRRLAMSGMTPSDALALFGTMFGMTMPLITFPIAFISPLTTVTVPRLSEGAAVGNIRDMRRKAGKTIHATGLLAFPALFLLIPLGAPLCTLIYGNADSGAYIAPLCLSAFFSYYQITCTALLNGAGKQRSAATTVLIGGGIELFFTYLSGIFGIRAFLLGHILSPAVCTFLNLRILTCHPGISLQWRNWFVTPLLSALLSGVCVNLIYAILCATGIHTALSIAVCLPVGILIYYLALRVQGTSPFRYLKTLIPQSQIHL